MRGAFGIPRADGDGRDALRPRYGRWNSFDQMILATTQWCFLSILMGEV